MAQTTQQWPPSLRVALIQMHPEPLQPQRNFATAAQHIENAASQGATLAVLPEYHLSGWQPEDPRFQAIAAGAQQYISKYQELAKQHKINVVPGTIVTLTPSDTTSTILLNKAFFISATGDILGEYTKVNLWHPERDHLTSGPDHCSLTEKTSTSHHEVIHTPIGPVGLLICYDLCFPEAARALVKAGARIVIIPTFTKSDDMSLAARSYNQHGEKLFVQSALVSRAFENTCCIIFCNVGGPEDEGYMGLSQVVLPLIGSVEGSSTDSSPSFRLVDVDLTAVDAAEANYKIRQDLAKQDFHYL